MISKHHGNIDVYGVYNGTDGLCFDLLEVMCQKLGIPTNAQVVAQRGLQEIVDGMGEYKHHGTLIVQAHSQGCETVHNLSANLKSMMELTAYGPARVPVQGQYKSAETVLTRSILSQL